MDPGERPAAGRLPHVTCRHYILDKQVENLCKPYYPNQMDLVWAGCGDVEFVCCTGLTALHLKRGKDRQTYGDRETGTETEETDREMQR